MTRRAKTVSREANKLIASGQAIQKRILIAIPTTGLVRVEWMHARYGQTIPVNWSHAELTQFFDTFSPMSYNVADARNISVDYCVKNGFEWILFIDHDVLLPQDTFVKMNAYMRDGSLPVVSGLYAAKGQPAEPLIFRGSGNSYYPHWKRGEKVWADGIPMGCALINGNLLRMMWDASPTYEAVGQKVREVFITPRGSKWSLEENSFRSFGGTEDLHWCNRVIQEGWLKKAGFEKIGKRRWPFLVDTSIWCGHIEPNGQIFWPEGY